MRISVVTVVRNAAMTVERTIRSVLAADHGDLEYLVIDGASTDGTQEVVRRFEGVLAGWVSEPDAGISDGFNKGIRLATGEVVGLISGDDELWPGALDAVAAAFTEHPEADVVHGNAVYVSRDGRRVVTRPERDFSNVLRRSPIRHAAMFVRRSAYERYGLYDVGYRYAMDYELILRFHRAGARFLHLDRILAQVAGGGASGRSYRAAIAETRDISILYGHAVPLAYLSAYGHLARTVVKRGLQGGGLGWIVELYRRRSAARRRASAGRRIGDLPSHPR